MARVEWNGREAGQRGRQALVTFLHAASITIVNRAKELLSHPGTGRVKGKRAGPAVHSTPGDPPYKQTGRLRASVTREVDEQALMARVGTNVIYGKALELGTRRGLAPRPWLRRAFAECTTQIQHMAERIGISLF